MKINTKYEMGQKVYRVVALLNASVTKFLITSLLLTLLFPELNFRFSFAIALFNFSRNSFQKLLTSILVFPASVYFKYGEIM